MNMNQREQSRVKRSGKHTPTSLSGVVMALLKPGIQGEEENHRTRVSLAFLASITVVLLIPFVNKAFNMDDPLFLWIAGQIQKHPLDPLGFDVIWYWTEEPMHVVTKNPPLVAYYIAGVTSLVGWSEPALHIAFLPPAIALVTGTYLLARHFCPQPGVAALMTLLTPVFLVSNTTVMCDATMLAFWVFSMYFWIRGLEENSRLLLLLSSVLVVASALSKYYGISLIPLLFVYTLAKYRRLVPSFLFLLIPIAILVAYQWVTESLYGRGLLADAAAYATNIRPAELGIPTKGLIALTFTGGCMVSMAFFVHLLWQRKFILISLALAFIVMFVASSLKSTGGYPLPTDSTAYWLRAGQIGLFAVAGLGLLSLSLVELYKKRDAETLVLSLWVIGTFLFAGFVNWSTNARSIPPMVPPMAILITRRLVEQGAAKRIGSPRRLYLPLAGAAFISLAVCWSDYKYANSARDGAAEVLRKVRGTAGTVWFQGHWGFQYYMQMAGAKPIDTKRATFNPGDIVVQPSNNTNLFPMEYDWATRRESIQVKYSSFLSTMNFQVAGFYADERGPLPFAFGPVPPEQYHIFDVH